LIEFVSGALIFKDKKTVVIKSGGLGWSVFVTNPDLFSQGAMVDFFCTMVWNQDRGPSLFGFSSIAEKKTFDLLRECHKVGPQLSLQILAQISPSELFHTIVDENDRALSKINGIGPKTAKNIISALSEKAVTFLAEFDLNPVSGEQHVFSQVREALSSLGYASSEVAQAIKFVASDKEAPFDVTVKKALGFLYANK
jgi:Holliday junction DNA helicase RuvA